MAGARLGGVVRTQSLSLEARDVLAEDEEEDGEMEAIAFVVARLLFFASYGPTNRGGNTPPPVGGIRNMLP